MEINAGKYKVISTGSVITFHKEPLEFILGDKDSLTIKAVFVDDVRKEENQTTANAESDNTLILTFYNFSFATGIGNVEPIKIGIFNDRDLYMNYIVTSMNKNRGFLFNYSFYSGEAK